MPNHAITKTAFENVALLYSFNFAGPAPSAAGVGGAPPAGGFHKIGAHSIYDPAACRVNMTYDDAGADGLSHVSISADLAAGPTIYLPFTPNEITSVVLSDPPLPGVNKFSTANLSGCMIFVDKIGATNNLIVYHANAIANSPPANQGAVDPTLETPGAQQALTALHVAAAGDYAAAPYNYAGIANVGSVNKPTYNINAGNLVQRKRQQGRLRVPQAGEPPNPQRVDAPEFLGGTIVFGFYVAHSGWEIYYQTWGAVEYKRAKTAVAGSILHGREERADHFPLVQFGGIYPHVFNRNI